jgi:hypothetical protein
MQEATRRLTVERELAGMEAVIDDKLAALETMARARRGARHLGLPGPAMASLVAAARELCHEVDAYMSLAEKAGEPADKRS